VQISAICGQQKKSKVKRQNSKKTTSANPHTLQIIKVNQCKSVESVGNKKKSKVKRQKSKKTTSANPHTLQIIKVNQ